MKIYVGDGVLDVPEGGWGMKFCCGIYGRGSPRRGEGTHLRPKSHLTAVGLRNAPAGAAPYGMILCLLCIEK